MKPLTQQQMEKAAEVFKHVATDEILRKIDQLNQNVDTLKSNRITIVCLPEFKKIQATRDLLIAIMRKRDGRALPKKTTPVPK